jgi:hypothetical protein
MGIVLKPRETLQSARPLIIITWDDADCRKKDADGLPEWPNQERQSW